MIVVTRKEGEALMIGGNVRVVFLGTRRGGKVRLGIEAPKTIVVDREEVHHRRQADAARREPATAAAGPSDGGLAG